MPGLLVFRGPENRLGGVGEVAAGEVGRRVGLFPRDVVEDFEAELLHGEADGEDDVVRAGDPDRAVGLEDALAAGEPFAVEVVVLVRALGFVPVALVHLHHFAGVAGDAAIGEKIGRVGKDAVEAAFGIFGGYGVEQLEAVAVVEPEAARGVGEDQRRGAFLLAAFDGNRAVFAKLKVGGSERRGGGEVVVCQRICRRLAFDAVKGLWFAWRFGFRHAGIN